MRRLALGLCLLLSCGGSPGEVGLRVEVYGVSARAAAVVLKVIPPTEGVGCGAILSLDLPAIETEVSARWERDSASARRLELPAVPASDVLVLVYTEDETGAVFQSGCAAYGPAQATRGERVVFVQLSDPPPRST